MSQENVEIALAAVDAWNRGDLEAWMALWDEEAEFYPLRAQLEGESYRGHDGLERFLSELAEDFEDVRLEIEEIVERAIAAYSDTGEVPEDLFDPEVEVWESPELPGDLAGSGYDNLVR